jgi:hypothetical protein
MELVGVTMHALRYHVAEDMQCLHLIPLLCKPCDNGSPIYQIFSPDPLKELESVPNTAALGVHCDQCVLPDQVISLFRLYNQRIHLPPNTQIPKFRTGADCTDKSKLVGCSPWSQHGREEAQSVRVVTVLCVSRDRDDSGAGDRVLIGHSVEHDAGGVGGGAAATHGDQVVDEDDVVGEAGVRRGE